MRLLFALLAVALVCGCGPSYPTPFTAEDMAKVGTGEALVHYLGQTGATAAVCHRNATKAHFQGSRDDDFLALTDGLLGGDVRPDLWQRCTMIMLESMPVTESASLLDAMAHAYRRLLGRGSIEKSGDEQAKLEALHKTFLLRPRGTAPHDAAIHEDIEKLREALTKARLGPVASQHGRDLLVTIDLDQGLWKGAPITVAALDALKEAKDESLLRRIALRVPDPALQTEARRRIVRLHIAASPSADVHKREQEIEATVMATGRNVVSLRDHAATTAWLDEDRARVKGVLIRQDVENQTVTLLAYAGDKPGVTVIPSLDLRGALYARVAGVSDPVTLCAPVETLDVSPCILPAEVHPKVPIVYLDPEGLLHFVDRVTSGDALRLVYSTPNLPLPFEVGGRATFTVEWPISFERPPNMVFTGPVEGRGPDIRVALERRYAPRLLFKVTVQQKQLVGAVEASDLDAFLIATRGGAGREGTRGVDGSNGTNGSPGSSGSCPGSPGLNGSNGTNGGNGTPGGPGTAGGPGGDVVVQVACATGECGSVTGIAKKVVQSLGGAGGAGGEGGRGGRGGQGGSGGSGASCTDSQGHMTSVSGGTSGSSGSDGSPGARGANGRNGAPGHVEIHGAE